MTNIENSIVESTDAETGLPIKTIVIDSVQLRSNNPTDDRPLLDREPILRGSDANPTDARRLETGGIAGKQQQIEVAYIANKRFEITDDAFNILDKDGNTIYSIELDTDDVLNIVASNSVALSINKAGQVSNIKLATGMYDTELPANPSAGQLFFLTPSDATELVDGTK